MSVQTGSATYSPEDNKLRLYVGRVPRPEYDRLRAEGWTSTPKQDCDFVATWTPTRRDTALEYGDGFIDDEDQPMAERAADRADRFGGYRDKRLGEATGHADQYEAGPSVHGYQSQARGERAAARHDRIGTRATDAWSKADYWTSRTAGVISHALYKSRPDVRMGRIKVLEADLRKHEKTLAGYSALYADFQKLAAMEGEEQTKAVIHYVGTHNLHGNDYKHPRPETVKNSHIAEEGSSLYTLLRMVAYEYGSSDITGAEACAMFFETHSAPELEDDWTTHYKLRLAYENQMLDAQGGRAAHVEMIVGGFVGSHQIRKINKSPATGRVVSVQVLAKTRANFDRAGKPYGPDNPAPMTLHTLNVERLSKEVYRPPTPEEVQALTATKAEEKARAPKKDACPLLNPTDEDAEKLQALWNERARLKHEARNEFTSEAARAAHTAQFKASTVCRITQATYSANSKGAYAKAETADIEAGGTVVSGYNRREKIGKPICKVRTTPNGFAPDRVIVITDKPQKSLPPAVFQAVASDYALKVSALEAQGMTTSDAQAVLDAAELAKA